MEFATDGVFLCGLAHGPKLAEETISQACGAAAKACTILAKPYIEGEGMTARVNENLCSGCGLCVEICPFSAISLNETNGKASVNPPCANAAAPVRRVPNGCDSTGKFERQELIEAVDAALWEDTIDAYC